MLDCWLLLAGRVRAYMSGTFSLASGRKHPRRCGPSRPRAAASRFPGGNRLHWQAMRATYRTDTASAKVTNLAPLKVNLGCGSRTPTGWINVDYSMGARFAKIPLWAALN